MADQDGQDGSQSGAGATDAQGGEGDAGQTGEKDSSGAKGGTQSGAEKDADGSATVEKTELEKLRERMRAQDKHKATLEAELKQLKTKDLPEVEKLKSDLTEAQAALEKAQQDLDQTRIHNAFLSDNTHKWRNPKLALKNIDLSKVTIDSDGTVTGLKDALGALAKSDPYMLEPAQQDEDDDKGNSKKVFTPPGAGAGRQNDQTKTGLDPVRFPAMRGRISR